MIEDRGRASINNPNHRVVRDRGRSALNDAIRAHEGARIRADKCQERPRAARVVSLAIRGGRIYSVRSRNIPSQSASLILCRAGNKPLIFSASWLPARTEHDLASYTCE